MTNTHSAHTATQNDVYTFQVEAVFHMSDGSYFFVGQPDRPVPHLSPAKAEIMLDGEVVGTIEIDSERMPGPPPKRLQTLVSKGSFDKNKFGEQFLLKCTPAAQVK